MQPIGYIIPADKLNLLLSWANNYYLDQGNTTQEHLSDLLNLTEVFSDNTSN